MEPHTVNLAARVSAQAAGGEVLLTEATRHAAGTLLGIEIRERGRRELRNIAEPVTLYAAVRTGAPISVALPIDPVCRMAVDPDHAVGAPGSRGRGVSLLLAQLCWRLRRRPRAARSTPVT